MFRRHTLRAAAAIAAVGLLAACGTSDSGSTASGSGAPDVEGTLSTGWTTGITSLDPHMATSEIASFRFGLNEIYDRLFTVKADGTVDGMLVQDYSYSPDGLGLILNLREDVTFRDGTPLDAEVVKVNLDRARTVDSPSVKSRMAPVVDVAVTGPYQVTLTLAEPTVVVPYVLAEMAGFVMHPDLIANGNPATETNGSGAYSVESFAPGEELTIVRDRSDYWDADAAKLAKIEYKAISDTQAFTNAMAAGQIELGQFLPGTVNAVEGRKGLTTVDVPTGTGVELFLNRNIAPLDDVKVRQAINYAYNRDEIIEALYLGSEVRHQYSRPGLPGYDAELDETYTYDPAKAKQLLAEAGHPNGIDLGEVIITNVITPGVGDAMQEQFAQAGIKITPIVKDGLEGPTSFGRGEASALLHYSPLGTSFTSGSSYRWGPRLNPAGVTPEYTQMLAAANDSRRSEGEREASAAELNRYLVEQAWGAPLVWITYPWVMSDKVGNFSTDMDYSTTLGPFDFRYLTVSE
ncbi:ABC transporter substrate-binding protein [Rhodococcus sp. NPDC003382]|uniref:ABC transporter substrate-binding protein n=1 Tax=Rhodococcus sp. HM1 TaxID=2937759 RepID=UPI00200AAC55|nr:ABC transporter substrate-binding protein [Rhodococcus sp. HM1]MCK8669802.1 ABC transporter substrate-binding protein [Rhodococcus sp. HM1]